MVPPATYDRIGSGYEDYARTASFKQVEHHTFLELVGALHGERALDLACGFGFYTRELRRLGAARVVGVDVSPEMIRLAREHEAREPLGVEYLVADGAALPALGPFDLVTAVWMLNYAASAGQLEAMVRGAFAQLAPAGRFLAVTIHPDFTLAGPNSTKYGIRILRLVPEGDHVRMRGEFMTDPPRPVEVFQWSREAYETILRAAGFRDVRWEPFRVSPALVAEHGEAYWRDLRENCTGVVILARR